MKTSEILKQLKIRPETLSRWKQIEEFKSCLQKTQEKVLERVSLEVAWLKVIYVLMVGICVGFMAH